MNASSAADRPLSTAVGAALEPIANTTLVVAVSGGPDSLCLLHLLNRVAPKAGVKLHIAHLDHALRPDSAEDARFVEQIARESGLPLSVDRRVPPKRSEEAARKIRYTFFSEVAKAAGASAVAAGHTADDQAETVLLHVIRGSGLTGLAGMSPDTEVNGLRIIRPLLAIRRSQTHAYCERHTIRYRVDPSNRSPTFTRNRVRSEVLPLLRQLNPKVDEALLRLARAARQEEEFWRLLPPGLPRESMGSLPRAAQVRLFQEAYRTLTSQSLEATHIESLLAGKPIDLPGKIRAEPDSGKLVLRKAEQGPGWQATPLTVPGVTAAGPWKVTCTIVRPIPRAAQAGSACCVMHSAGSPLVLRPRRPGDRYRPIGMPASKKLQDILVDSKVPRRLRDIVPILEGPSGILWVGTHRIAEEAKLSADSQAALEVRLEPLSEAARELCRLYT